ncbi:hypothetical protein D8S78_01000 [Natrialba swarupiae]|nr:hypothetical protein [Natrialba swarupiae]
MTPRSYCSTIAGYSHRRTRDRLRYSSVDVEQRSCGRIAVDDDALGIDGEQRIGHGLDGFPTADRREGKELVSKECEPHSTVVTRNRSGVRST